MKRIVFILLAFVGMQRNSLACNKTVTESNKTDLCLDLFNAIHQYLAYRPQIHSANTSFYLTKIQNVLHKLKIAGIDMNTLNMGPERTPLHYAFSKNSIIAPVDTQLIELVYRYFSNVNTSLQNDLGYTVPMLAAANNQYKLLEKFLVIQPDKVPMNFAIKKRKSVLDEGKTILDYAKGKPEVETVINNYDTAYQQAIVDRVMISAPGMLKDLAKMVAGYATPVVGDDIEAERKYYEQEDKFFDDLAKTHQRKISR